MDWDDRHGWHKPLRTLILNDGREVYLMSLDIQPTYLGLLEGTPYKKMNWRHLNCLRDYRKSNESGHTSTQIIPSLVEEKADRRSMEEAFLPELQLLLNFHSDEMVEGEGAYSEMRIAYFCEKEDMLNLDKAIEIVRSEIEWNIYAKDIWP